jgi:tol-pal system protein YbgF
MKKPCFAVALVVACLAAPSADAQSWRGAQLGTTDLRQPLLVPVLDLGGDRGDRGERGGGDRGDRGGGNSSGGGGRSDLGDRVRDVGDALRGGDNSRGGGSPGGSGGAGSSGSGGASASTGGGSAQSARADDSSASREGPGERVSPGLTSLLGRIDALDRDVRGLRHREVASLGTVSLGASASGSGSVEMRLASLAREARAAANALHGEALRSEDVRRRLEKADQQLEQMFAEIDLAMTVEAAKPAPARASAQRRATPTTAETEPQAKVYEAIRVLGTGKNAEARALLRDFLISHPDDGLAPTAHYWLGETYFAAADFTSAGWIYAEAYEKDPTGPLAADNLLKLGMALAMLEKRRLACATFDKLESDFSPDSPQVAAGRQQGGSIGCD